MSGKDLGYLKLFRTAEAADTEGQLLDLLKAANLARLKVVTNREQLALDGDASGQERALLMAAAPGRDLRALALEVGKDPAQRGEALKQLRAALVRTAEGLAELHAKFHDPSLSAADRRAGRESDALYFLDDKLQRADVIAALGGRERAQRIEQVLRERELPKFLAADLPATAYHGDANLGNFKVDGWDGEFFKDVWTYDVGTMRHGFREGQDLRPQADPRGIKPAAAADSARLLESLESMVPEGTFTPEELRSLQEKFKARYKDLSRERYGIAIGDQSWNDAERWYRVEVEVAVALKGDATAIERIERILGISSPTTTRTP